MNRAALLASLALLSAASSAARADEAQTASAQTLVVVTPAAPVVVTSGAAAAGAAPAVVQGAGPGAALAAGGPQNERWSNVSHINGQVVPVGERGAYLYAFRRTNLSVNPIGPLLGYYDVAGAHALTQNVALSASISAWDVGGSSGFQGTVTAPIYFRRAFSGPFVEPGLISRSTQQRVYDYAAPVDGGVPAPSASATDVWSGVEVLVGWHWSFDSGLNLATAFGSARHVSGQGEGDNEPVAYVRAGYAF